MIVKDFPTRIDYRADIDDFYLETFQQVWPSTALGFPGLGGQKITTATTYVLVPVLSSQKYHVYFAGEYAYSAYYSDAFAEDLKNRNMASVLHSDKYNTQAQQEENDA